MLDASSMANADGVNGSLALLSLLFLDALLLQKSKELALCSYPSLSSRGMASFQILLPSLSNLFISEFAMY
jgi:hypothetical protein